MIWRRDSASASLPKNKLFSRPAALHIYPDFLHPYLTCIITFSILSHTQIPITYISHLFAFTKKNPKWLQLWKPPGSLNPRRWWWIYPLSKPMASSRSNRYADPDQWLCSSFFPFKLCFADSERVRLATHWDNVDWIRSAFARWRSCRRLVCIIFFCYILSMLGKWRLRITPSIPHWTKVTLLICHSCEAICAFEICKGCCECCC